MIINALEMFWFYQCMLAQYYDWNFDLKTYWFEHAGFGAKWIR